MNGFIGYLLSPLRFLDGSVPSSVSRVDSDPPSVSGPSCIHFLFPPHLASTPPRIRSPSRIRCLPHFNLCLSPSPLSLPTPQVTRPRSSFWERLKRGILLGSAILPPSRVPEQNPIVLYIVRPCLSSASVRLPPHSRTYHLCHLFHYCHLCSLSS